MTRFRGSIRLLVTIAALWAGSAALAPRGASEGSAVVGLRQVSPAFRGASDPAQPSARDFVGQASGAAVRVGSPVPSAKSGAPILPLARNRHAPGTTHAPTVASRPSGEGQSVAATGTSPSQTRASARPQPRHSSSAAPSGPTAVIAGIASWFCIPGRSACTSGYPASCACAAAGPLIRAALGDWRGREVTVWRADHRASVVVRLVDWCACPGGRVLDLYAGIYGQLDSLASGLLDVEVEV